MGTELLLPAMTQQEKEGDASREAGAEPVPHDVTSREQEPEAGGSPPLSGSDDCQQEEDGCSTADPRDENGTERKSGRELREERRRHNNALRKARFKAGKRERRDEREAQLQGLPEEQQQQQQSQWREQKRQAKEAKQLQEQRLQEVLAGRGPALRIAIECSFSDLPGNDKFIRSLCKQLEVALGFNKKSERPAAVLVCSFTGRVAEVANSMTAKGWRAQKLEQPIVELFPCQELVILSPDAELPLLELDVQKVYCIGGIVDRTVKKGLTLGYAEANGATARRLPIEEYAAELGLSRGTQKNPVLNVNDAMVALIEYHRTGCWVSALDAAIPGRKRRTAPGVAAGDAAPPPGQMRPQVPPDSAPQPPQAPPDAAPPPGQTCPQTAPDSAPPSEQTCPQAPLDGPAAAAATHGSHTLLSVPPPASSPIPRDPSRQ